VLLTINGYKSRDNPRVYLTGAQNLSVTHNITSESIFYYHNSCSSLIDTIGLYVVYWRNGVFG